MELLVSKIDLPLYTLIHLPDHNLRKQKSGMFTVPLNLNKVRTEETSTDLRT